MYKYLDTKSFNIWPLDKMHTTFLSHKKLVIDWR
jgi:hypothetical protein